MVYDFSSLYLGQMLHPMLNKSCVRWIREENYYPRCKQWYVLNCSCILLGMIAKEKGILKLDKTRDINVKLVHIMWMSCHV